MAFLWDACQSRGTDFTGQGPERSASLGHRATICLRRPLAAHRAKQSSDWCAVAVLCCVPWEHALLVPWKRAAHQPAVSETVRSR